MKALQCSDDQNYLELITLMTLLPKKNDNEDYSYLVSELLNYRDKLKNKPKNNNFEKCQQIKEALLPYQNENHEDEGEEDFTMPF